MSQELKDETLKALKAGVYLLEKIKINLVSIELRNKLDEVHTIFQELVKKWDGNDTRMETGIIRNKNVLTKSTSAVPIVKKELAERKTFPLNTISENIGEQSKPNKKEKRSLFQQMRRRSKGDENLTDAVDENTKEKKRISAQDIVHIPKEDVKDSETYLCLQGADSDYKMCSDTSNFSKVTKIKLKVNDKAIGGRMCCLQGTNVLIGRELNDQVAEYGLNLKEYYRITNLKSLYFELSKREAVYSFRFQNESECLDWYNTIDKIIETQGLYSYVSVPAGGKSNTQKVTPMRHKLKTFENTVTLVDSNPNYDYPEFQVRKPRATTAFELIDEPDSIYSYTNSLTSTLKYSMDMEFSENVTREFPRSKNILNGVKPTLGRERSMSM